MSLKRPFPFIYLLMGLSVLPFLWLFTQQSVRGDFYATFANVSGFIGAVLMVWQTIISNRVLLKKITPQYVASIKTHIFLGTYSFILILTHPILEMLDYGESWAFLLLPDLSTEFMSHVSIGKVALYLFLLTWIASTVIRNKIPYRWWQRIHYLNYPLLFLVFAHADEIGTFLNVFPLIRVYWLIWGAIYGGVVLLKVGQLLNVDKKVYYVKEMHHQNDITYMTVQPQGPAIHPQVGQFCFVKLDSNSEAHPFTVMQFNQKTGELQFGIKQVGPFTKKLAQLTEGDVVFIDGPYGVFTQEGQNSEPKVIIAGGIGATPFMELVRRFSNNKTFMLHANRTMKEVVGQQQFRDTLEQNYIDIISREQVTAKQAVSGRINAQVIAQHVPAPILSSARFFVCGSAGFMNSVFEALEELKVDRGRIYAEEFSL